MENISQLKGNRILVKDVRRGKQIADTKIIDVNVDKNLFLISASSVTGRINQVVTALVFTADGIQEYAGVLRPAIIANELEIAIGAGKKLEERSCERYDIQTEGTIDAIVLGGKKIPLRKPIEVVTENVSARGALICTFPGSLEVGDRIQMTLNLKVTQYRSEYEIVRIQNSSHWNEEYGCQDVSLMKKEDE